MRKTTYEAEVLANDMGGYWPILVRYRLRGTDDAWTGLQLTADGKVDKNGGASICDLLPPKLSRDEVASKCVTAFLQGYDDGGTTGSGVRAVIECYDQLRREGLCDE